MTDQEVDSTAIRNEDHASGLLRSLGAPQHLGSRPKLTEMVADDLRRSILEGMNEGDALPTEGQLAKHYGTSSPTIRQALRVLESEGLISIRRGPHGGPVVRYPTVEDITRNVGVYMQVHGVSQRELYEVRGSLEIEAALQIANHREPDVIRALEENLQAHRKAIDAEDSTVIAREHLRFHDLLLEMSGNKAITTIGHITRLVLSSIAAETTLQLSESDEASRREVALMGVQAHQELLELISAGDAAGAAARMARHLGRWLEIAPLN